MSSVKQVTTLRAFVAARGAEILEPTNEWELLRFSTEQGVGIVYRNAKGNVSYTGEAMPAFKAMAAGLPWRAGPRTGRGKPSVKVRSVRKRDGDLCFFCQGVVSDEEASVEHLVPAAHHGPNHISNLFLAHVRCNQRANHLSAPEKVAIHVEAKVRLALSAAREQWAMQMGVPYAAAGAEDTRGFDPGGGRGSGVLIAPGLAGVGSGPETDAGGAVEAD